MTHPPTRRPRWSAISRDTPRLAALPLRVRLVALLVLLLLVALSLTSIATSAVMRRQLMDSVDRDLNAAAEPTASQVLTQLFNHRGEGIPTNYAVRFMPTDGSSPFGVNPTGEQLHPDIPTLALNDPRVVNGILFTVSSTDGEMRWRVVPGELRDGSATFAVAVPLRGVDTTIRRMLSFSILIGLAVIASCALLGWFGVRRAFRPLAQIEDTAAGIAGGDLTQRIPEPTSKDEVASLARSLNAMLAQVEQSFAVREASEGRMRQFVADASHELRTPLATVRGYAELFRQGAVTKPDDVAGAMRRIEDEAIRMGGLVEDLLLLTRLDSQRPLKKGPVDLTVLAADAVQDARALDSTRQVRLLGLSGDLQPTTIEGDEARLRQVVSNLVGNAVNHTPQGTDIEIAVGSDAGRAKLEVRDHGAGVDPVRARKVFERFYRADASRVRGNGGGNGLGLAIVAAIVSAHGGRVGVAATPGGGATFVVDLPTVNSQSEPSNV
ncbi:MAG TPA: HAMP domain-containing sensor histidine kinase [Dermatophilaceae bacterium]|nr:HAMP domain-containing sensor histidine kinase [Dermatophilaceae bacterium]